MTSHPEDDSSSQIPQPIIAVPTHDNAAVEPVAGSAENQNVKKVMDWRLVPTRPRVDSFNQEFLFNELRELRASGCLKIALDLKANRFLSLQVIQFCGDFAKQMQSDGGKFALISCPEKSKRHFEIYGSLRHIQVVRDEMELVISGPRIESAS
jgi:anti-anti-sigma regulatory factor